MKHRRYAPSVRFAAAALVIWLLSGCAVQICGDEFPERASSCPIDSLAPFAE